MFNAKKKKNRGNNRIGKTRNLGNKLRDTKGKFHANMGTIKDRNSINLAEGENMKCGKSIREELYQRKGLNHLDNHNGVVTHIEQITCGVMSSGP